MIFNAITSLVNNSNLYVLEPGDALNAGLTSAAKDDKHQLTRDTLISPYISWVIYLSSNVDNLVYCFKQSNKCPLRQFRKNIHQSSVWVAMLTGVTYLSKWSVHYRELYASIVFWSGSIISGGSPCCTSATISYRY